MNDAKDDLRRVQAQLNLLKQSVDYALKIVDEALAAPKRKPRSGK